MKTVLLPFLFFSCMAVQCSTIAQLKSTADVETFVRTYDPKISKDPMKFSIKSTDQLASEMDCNGTFKAWAITNWEKADLNNDGRIDLLLIGDWYGMYPLIVLDLDNGNFEFIPLKGHAFDNCQLFKPITIADKIRIKTSSRVPENRPSITPGGVRYRTDTLSFFNNTLVRYNPKPASAQIASIRLRTTPCFGACPEFDLELLPNDTGRFEGKQHTPIIGKQTIQLNAGTFQDLQDLLNYMDVSTLDSSYAVSWTDDQTGTLSITMTNGSTSTIQDYGMQGTPGLKAVYQKFMAIVKGIATQ